MDNLLVGPASTRSKAVAWFTSTNDRLNQCVQQVRSVNILSRLHLDWWKYLLWRGKNNSGKKEFYIFLSLLFPRPMLRFGQITLTASQLLQNLDVIKHTIQRSSETMVDTSEFDPELVLSPEFPEVPFFLSLFRTPFILVWFSWRFRDFVSRVVLL